MKVAPHRIRRYLLLAVGIYLVIGIVVGLLMLNEQLTHQLNWRCPPSVAQLPHSSLPVFATTKINDECVRIFSFTDGLKLVGQGIIFWPMVAYFLLLKGSAGFLT